MQDDQKSMEENAEHVTSPSQRTQRIIEHLEKQWQRPYEPTHDTLKRITEFVVNLPEKYRTAGLTAIADHIANNLILHFLDTMAIFRQKAEQEGIDLEEREEYLSYILTEFFPKIIGINRIVSIHSLDDLAVMSNITLSLQTLSHIDTAEEAQSWMYELPKMYPSELLQENLVVNRQEQEREQGTSTTILCSNLTNWPSYKQGYVISEIGAVQATELIKTTPLPKPILFSFKRTRAA